MKWYSPLLLALVFLVGCHSIKEPEFRKIDAFRIKNVSLQEATVGFNVTYFNPNGFGVTAKEAHIDVYLDSLFLGQFRSDSAVQVNRSADFSIPFSGAVPLQSLLQLKVQDLVKRDVLIRANGSVKVGKAGIFVTEPIRYEGMHNVSEIGKFYSTQ
jgi:LEA14-like dessication related protein